MREGRHDRPDDRVRGPRAAPSLPSRPSRRRFSFVFSRVISFHS
jgi:hypothetical protein